LALVFDDIYSAAADMQACGELTAEQVAAAGTLDELLILYSGAQHQAFWAREALWHDNRWEQIRSCARQVLNAFPEASPHG
jgi:hypothetical protein